MPWTCSNDHTNADAAKFCKSCGEDGPASKPTSPPSRNGLPMWQGLPRYTKPHDDDVCGEWREDGTLCQKTVAEHIAEFRAISERPGNVFSRPSQRETQKWALPDEDALEQRRQELLRQADLIRKNLPGFEH